MNVYVLIDPTDNVFKYIGMTSKSVEHRVRMHIKDARTLRRQNRYLNKKNNWLLSLCDKGLYPSVISLVKDISKDTAILVERNIIAIVRRVSDGGTLLNIQKGGSYDSDKATPWNRGLTNCYSQSFIDRMKLNQSNRKEVYRFDKSGNLVDVWISTRTMCAELGFDRRTVQRCLNKRPSYLSHKGHMFSYSLNDVPVYINKSVTHGKYCKAYV